MKAVLERLEKYKKHPHLDFRIKTQKQRHLQTNYTIPCLMLIRP